MKIYSNKKIKTKVLVDILCDMCGQSCWDCDKINLEASNLIAAWGYNSKKDGIKWDSYFCEECSDRIEEFIESNGGTLSKSDYNYGTC